MKVSIRYKIRSARDVDEILWRQAGAQAKLAGKNIGQWLNEAIKYKLRKEGKGK